MFEVKSEDATATKVCVHCALFSFVYAILLVPALIVVKVSFPLKCYMIIIFTFFIFSILHANPLHFVNIFCNCLSHEMDLM